ncbi:MAG: NHL repeat-containing protein [Nitrospinae bacterium]|nr:NHL repeat-containing protein [Nitrospinota bacterium]
MMKMSLLIFGILIILTSKVESTPSNFYFISAIEKFSDEYRFEGLSSIFINDEELYVVDNGGNHIYIFNLDGSSVFQFGKEKGIALPIDVFVYNNYMYVSAEGKDFIEILNMRGEKIGKIEPPYEGFTPGKMAAIEREGFFVVDRKSLNICVFDRDGKYQYNFGGRNLFKSIGGIAAKNGKIYVSVMSADPVIRVFDTKGEYLTGFGHIGESDQNFSMPSGIKVDDNGNIWVVDAFKHRVIGFNIEGKKQNEFGISGNPKEDLYYPLGIDSKGDIFYVIEKGRGRISMFRRVD